MNEDLKIEQKFELYAKLYGLESVEDLQNVFNYYDLYSILYIYSWEYEFYNVLLNELWDKEKIEDYVKGRLNSLLDAYQKTNVIKRKDMLRNYLKKINKIFNIQACYKIEKFRHFKISNRNNEFKSNLREILLKFLEMSDIDIERLFMAIQPNRPNNQNKSDARHLNLKVYLMVVMIKKLIDELKPIDDIKKYRTDTLLA